MIFIHELTLPYYHVTHNDLISNVDDMTIFHIQSDHFVTQSKIQNRNKKYLLLDNNRVRLIIREEFLKMQNQNQGGQQHMNMETGPIPAGLNHGGHEVMDVHEVLSTAIGAMDHYTMFRSHIKDTNLLDILDRQYQFMQQEYNTTVDCFLLGRIQQFRHKAIKCREAMIGSSD